MGTYGGWGLLVEEGAAHVHWLGSNAFCNDECCNFLWPVSRPRHWGRGLETGPSEGAEKTKVPDVVLIVNRLIEPKQRDQGQKEYPF